MSIHLGAQRGDIAPIVLLPGDPLRARFIAERFLTGTRCHNEVRAAYGYTGDYRGRRVSVQATGMGMPSAAIYVHELLAEHDVRVLLRVGTCGSIQPKIGLRELVLAASACTDSAMFRARFGGASFAPTADFELLRRASELAAARGVATHVGPVLTSDTFYADDPHWWERWAEHGVLAAEMETAAVYTLAARAGAKALSLLTVSDLVVTGEQSSSEERERSFEAMIGIALDVAAGCPG
jgi:purine-nucleoside phosphorylase